MKRKRIKPEIYSVKTSWGGDTKSFDAFIETIINDCLNSDWQPTRFDFDEIPFEISAEEIKILLNACENDKNSRENSVA